MDQNLDKPDPLESKAINHLALPKAVALGPGLWLSSVGEGMKDHRANSFGLQTPKTVVVFGLTSRTWVSCCSHGLRDP
eukprot:CAMPEP_0206470898 /NCGR_PEP_ID=MMETSP0324_2-20121206/31225_1 /ASSEMBLY_ACC=CAM_ASM_000836 /TAXON_ID=2866 /ORGANISM="Crypthecodinium cohnii, Strain Seligo" /LENGTH=77 /DNA_ID=CAMNT_0053945087 /DNA_START=173 /DNA_END=403 /DNA_ORIENTATION=-